MKKIYFATKNKGKVRSVSTGLSKYGIEVIHKNIELPEPRTDNLREIAIQKVMAAYKKLRKPVIAQDSGFYVHSLNGFPKSFVNFVLETIGIEGILKLIEDKPRECKFRSCLAYYDKDLKEPVLFESDVKGVLVKSPRGEIRDYFWSDLFLVFVPDGETKTLAEMTWEEYEEWRKKRLLKHSFITKFAKWFLKQR